jgi:hypothetical protein
MLVDVMLPIVVAADLPSVGSPVDAALTHRPQQKAVVFLHNPHFFRLFACAVGRHPEEVRSR